VIEKEQAGQEGDAVGADVERLAREVARRINEVQPDEREYLREFAVSILRDEVHILEPPRTSASGGSVGTFNFFGIGIPLFLTGAVLVFLFPPIGLLFFAAGALTVICGVGAVAFGRWRGTS
jgi:hypothetical protein